MDSRARLNELLPYINEMRQNDKPLLLSNYKNETKGGSISVLSLHNQLAQVKEILYWFDFDKVMLLPSWKFSNLTRCIDQIIQRFDRIHTHEKNPGISEAAQQNSLEKPFTSNEQHNKDVEEAWSLIVESLTLSNAANTETTGLIQKQKDAAEALDNIRKDGNTVRGLVESLNVLSQEAAISKHGLIFSQQATKHGETAAKWQTALFCLIGIDVILIIALFVCSLMFDDKDAIKIGIFGGLLISLTSFMIAISIKNYFAERHNQTINNHKANCLLSYQTFAATASETVRDSVLTFTTQTIFAPFNPGFLSKEAMQTPMPLLEVIRAVQPEKKV